MTDIPAATARPIRYEVSCLPDDNPEAFAYALTVEWRGEGRWAVLKRGISCLSVDGSWDYEHIPSERRDDWLATHRFDLDTALAKAVEEAPKVKVNGYSIADLLDWQQSRARAERENTGEQT